MTVHSCCAEFMRLHSSIIQPQHGTWELVTEKSRQGFKLTFLINLIPQKL